MASVISSNTQLKELYLGNNQLGFGVIKLATSLKKISSLKVLDLADNSIPEQAVSELTAAIKSQQFVREIMGGW